MKKRLVSIFLALAMCMGLAVPAVAVDSIKNSVAEELSPCTQAEVIQMVDYVVQNEKTVETAEPALTIKNDSGLLYNLPVAKLEEQVGDIYSTTYAVDLVETASGDIITTGSQENTANDGSYSVKAYIKIEYKKKTSAGAPDSYLLTKVSGGWTISNQVQLVNQEVIYACGDPNGGKREVKNPTSTKFSYDTGFTYYARDLEGGVVGARSETTILRGTGSWTLAVDATIFVNGVDFSN